MESVSSLKQLQRRFELDTGLPLVLAGTAKYGPKEKNGRLALIECFRKLGQGNAFTAMGTRFPSSYCSVSHDDISIAIATKRGCTRGIGIDIERLKKINPLSARLFMNNLERRKIQAITRRNTACADHDLLRVWTIKEAAFKADENNRNKSWFLPYSIDNPSEIQGDGSIKGKRYVDRFRYTSYMFKNYLVSLSVVY